VSRANRGNRDDPLECPHFGVCMRAETGQKQTNARSLMPQEDFAVRLLLLEAALGIALPPEYVAFLRTHRSRDLADVSAGPWDHYGDVRNILELGPGSAAEQVDETWRLVKDALPPRTVPIAADGAGNLYLLEFGHGDQARVVWWDHERFADEFHTEPVADSFTAFIENISRNAL
jgi:hypothetical protein